MQHLTIQETLSLLRMGHSEQEIMEYINDEPAAPVSAPAPAPASVPAPVPTPAPAAPAPASVPTPAPAAPAPASVPTPAPAAPAPAPAAPAPAPAAPAPAAPAPAPVAPGTELDRLFAKLTDLTNAIQAGNRAYADMGANIIDPRTTGMTALAGLSGYTMNKED